VAWPRDHTTFMISSSCGVSVGLGRRITFY